MKKILVILTLLLTVKMANIAYAEAPMKGYFTDVIIYSTQLEPSPNGDYGDASENIQDVINRALKRLESVYGETHVFDIHTSMELREYETRSDVLYVTIIIMCTPK